MELVDEFMGLFAGLERAYGTFEIRDSRERDAKKTGKVNNVRAAVNRDVWLAHINGLRAIGIIPIRDDNNCLFGAIDIDVYEGLDHAALAKQVEKVRMPLVPCRSKSGGMHLWLFLKEPTPASFVQRKLREMAASLGYGKAEIFPKQTELLAERGDIGNWINMPYFNGMEGGRYGLHLDGTPMSPAEFVSTARVKRVNAEELESFQAKTAPELSDGPPCLQHLCTQGFPQGTRNNGLYNLGVYAKKAYPDSWEAIVEQYNLKYLNPPLGSTEVKDVVKSLKKKDYQFTCTQIPIVNHCNSALCRGRKFGVGDHSGMPVITGLTKYDSQPPIWFADIEGGGRLELSTEDLQNQLRFQRRCMEILNSMPAPMNQRAWQVMVQNLLDNVSLIEAPKDASAKGQLSEMIEKFCTQRAQAISKEEVRLGKPFTDKGKTFFTINGLMAFLERHKYREVRIHEVSSYLKNEMQATHHFFNFRGKGVNCWAIDAYASDPTLDVPSNLQEGAPF
jgi:hypothetical protein